MLKQALCVIVALIVCVALAPAAASAAAPIPYAALGDSFSSGEGNGPFDSKCHRAKGNDSAYPQMLPRLVGYLAPPSFHACTGAKIADVWQRPQPRRGNQEIQIDYLSDSTRLVTLTIGGNDLSFAPIVRLCLLPIIDCTKSKLARHISADLDTVKTRLAYTYTRIRERMDPGGLLIVAGYPRLFAQADAGCQHFITSKEAKWMNSLVEKGNRRIVEAVGAADAQSNNVSYVDVTERFADHGLCNKEPWLYGIKPAASRGLIKGSYHPRPSGQKAYADAFATYLRQPAIQTALIGPLP